MQEVTATGAQTESQFAALVDALAAAPGGRGRLTDLLREDHPAYDGRGAAATVRMRGWIMLALARAGVSDDSLVFVLEELDAGTDAYLVAAAARALRSYPRPGPALAPFLIRALNQIRYRDEPISFEGYGEYAIASSETTAVRELLATLTWLGPHARGVLPEVEALCSPNGGLPRKLLGDVGRAAEAIRGGGQTEGADADACCELPRGIGDALSWALGSRRGSESVESVVFEDHDGGSVTFGEFFRGQPSVVVFFYTRCDNPLKCSLTVAKLARVQKLLEARGLAGEIRTAAISYDPAFDLPERLRGYGQNRGVRMDDGHRMLRAVEGGDALRRHFKLGVNFVGSLVNRHRIEVYVLDADGRVAASFQRLHWDEEQVAERAVEVLEEGRGAAAVASEASVNTRSGGKAAAPVFGTLASLAVAFFPKCPLCWAAYLSLFGVAGLHRIPYSPWLQPVFVSVMLVNLAALWLRGRSTGRMGGFYLAGAGAVCVLASKLGPGFEQAAAVGVGLTLAGSLLSALSARRPRPLIKNSAESSVLN